MSVRSRIAVGVVALFAVVPGCGRDRAEEPVLGSGASQLGHPRDPRLATEPSSLPRPRWEVAHGRLRIAPGRLPFAPGALLFSYDGSGANGYSRLVYDIGWPDRATVRYGASLFLPRGFTADMRGQVAIIRWDNYARMPRETERGGIAIWRSDRRARLFRSKDQVEQIALTRGVKLPEGRWFRLEVRQRLGTRRAVNTVLLDGRPVARSRAANSYGHEVGRLRVGISAVDAQTQNRPLLLYLDGVWGRVTRLAHGRRGPFAGRGVGGGTVVVRGQEPRTSKSQNETPYDVARFSAVRRT